MDYTGGRYLSPGGKSQDFLGPGPPVTLLSLETERIMRKLLRVKPWNWNNNGCNTDPGLAQTDVAVLPDLPQDAVSNRAAGE
jgi:hypothetical protein